MLLQELSTASGVSTASIKYYRREGLLPPGDRITATRSDYGRRHLDRLALIQVLREIAQAPIPSIRTLCEALDDPDRPVLAALEIAQAIALDVPVEDLPGDSPADEDPRVRGLLAGMGWADVRSAPRLALDALLREMAAMEIPVSDRDLLRYAEPMAGIAAAEIAEISQPQNPWGGEEEPDAPPAASRDVMVLRTIVGSLQFARLLVILRALGHASITLSDADLSRTPDGSAPPRGA